MRRDRVSPPLDATTAINIPVPQEESNNSYKRGRLQMQFELANQEYRNRRASLAMYVLICVFLVEIILFTAVGFVVIVMHIH